MPGSGRRSVRHGARVWCVS
ncbi:hypothetical protein [Streptomyces sp. F63]